MSQSNPYTSPEEVSVSASAGAESADAASTARRSGGIVARAVEYAIAIVLIVALMLAFIQGII